MNLDLENKVALVTGGSRGLGAAICVALAAEGARVAVNYRTERVKAQGVVERIASAGRGWAGAFAGDVAEEASVSALFRAVQAACGRIDILVNNAGICPVSLVRDMKAEEWNRTIQTNLTGTFLASRELLRMCAEHGWGGARIVNIVSPAAFIGSASGKAHYSASKAGIVAFTVSLAREAAAQGIAVNAVAPGMMYTEMVTETLEKNEERYKEQIPLGRIAQPEEVAAIAVFLASGKASYMTGATVDVSGGLLMR
jgi:3-oxoacyl-[acyl-carrier protein] reductase